MIKYIVGYGRNRSYYGKGFYIFKCEKLSPYKSYRVLDIIYHEDISSIKDMNVLMTSNWGFDLNDPSDDYSFESQVKLTSHQLVNFIFTKKLTKTE